MYKNDQNIKAIGVYKLGEKIMNENDPNGFNKLTCAILEEDLLARSIVWSGNKALLVIILKNIMRMRNEIPR